MRLRAYLCFLILFGAGGLVLAAQIGPSSAPLQQDTAPAILPTMTFPPPGEGATGPTNFPASINPLTGLVVEDPTVLDRPPMVVKISNAPPLVRPQAGIGAADIVYEHYAEGGLTRFSAVFYSQSPTRAGSIRSARLIDYELTWMYRAILAFSGASIGVEKMIYGWEAVARRIPGSERVAPTVPVPPSPFAARAYMGVLYGPPYYYRDESIPVPHNMFVNTAALWDLAATQGYDERPLLEGMAFHPQPPEGATGPATRIDLRYRATRVRWEYDAETNRYRRFADGMGHFDANTLQQITTDNVVVLYVLHRETDIIESQFQNNISWSLEIPLAGEGDAILFRDGLRYDGRWVRDGRDNVLGLRTADGQLLYFKPGTTWFQVVRLPEQQNPAEEWLVVE